MSEVTESAEAAYLQHEQDLLESIVRDAALSIQEEIDREVVQNLAFVYPGPPSQEGEQPTVVCYKAESNEDR